MLWHNSGLCRFSLGQPAQRRLAYVVVSRAIPEGDFADKTLNSSFAEFGFVKSLHDMVMQVRVLSNYLGYRLIAE